MNLASTDDSASGRSEERQFDNLLSADAPARMVPEIAARFQISPDAEGLIRDDVNPREYVRRLMERELYPDAVRFMASALPKREAVWWAYQCARRFHGETPKERVNAVLEATQRWVVEPSDDNRRAAMAAAEVSEIGSPAGCAAVAAFWSEGSMAPPDVAPVPPAEHLAATGAASAVILAAVSREPEKAAEKYQQFVKLGFEITEGRSLWEKPPAADRKN